MDEAKSRRVHLIDEVRGVAILCMVVYHMFYDLVMIFDVKIPLFHSAFIQTLVPIFVFVFVSISGTASAYSKSNLFRGLKCFGLGMVMTLVTFIFMRDQLIVFGILHMLGVSMMLYALFAPLLAKVNPVVLSILSFILFILTYNIPNGYLGIGEWFKISLPSTLYDLGFLFPFGFMGKGFYSSDYFSLLPWFFAFVAGSGFGRILVKGDMPQFFYKSHIAPLAFIGRNTLLVYLLHQPIIYGILSLIFM